jgi:hypothetical protein
VRYRKSCERKIVLISGIPLWIGWCLGPCRNSGIIMAQKKSRGESYAEFWLEALRSAEAIVPCRWWQAGWRFICQKCRLPVILSTPASISLRFCYQKFPRWFRYSHLFPFNVVVFALAASWSPIRPAVLLCEGVRKFNITAEENKLLLVFFLRCTPCAVWQNEKLPDGCSGVVLWGKKILVFETTNTPACSRPTRN